MLNRAAGSKLSIRICNYLREEYFDCVETCCGPQGKLYRYATINFDGKVYPCPNVIGGSFGDIRKAPFLEIWLSDAMRKFKNDFDSRLECVRCGQCPDKRLIPNICRCKSASQKALEIVPDLQIIN
jgi:radical SAM protein with 4Fe4S-binding SPASM domain